MLLFFFRLEIVVQNIQTNKDYNLVNVDIFGWCPESPKVAPVDYKHTYHSFRSMSYNKSSFETISS